MRFLFVLALWAVLGLNAQAIAQTRVAGLLPPQVDPADLWQTPLANLAKQMNQTIEQRGSNEYYFSIAQDDLFEWPVVHSFLAPATSATISDVWVGFEPDLDNNQRSTLDRYNALKDSLTAVLGKPDQDQEQWLINKLASPRSEWANAIAYGDLILSAGWYRQELNITLIAEGHSGYSQVFIRLRPPTK